eukprot:Colp12_sorted_trinity150504_noHs@26611
MEEELVLCARYGEFDELKEYIEQGVKLTTVDGNGNTALHMAAANGHTDIVKFLLERWPKEHIGQKNNSGNTALHWAALNHHKGIVELLIGAGADPLAQNDAGKSAVYEAMNTGDVDSAAVLLNACPEAESTTTDERVDDEPDTPASTSSAVSKSEEKKAASEDKPGK